MLQDVHPPSCHRKLSRQQPGLLEGGVSDNIPTRLQDQYKDYCALSRAGRCEEVAELVAFLAGDHSSYVNAQAIMIDGGI